MKTKELIKLHERALETLNIIIECNNNKHEVIENAEICTAKFPDLKGEYQCEIDQLESIKINLENRYFDIAVKIEEVQNGK